VELYYYQELEKLLKNNIFKLYLTKINNNKMKAIKFSAVIIAVVTLFSFSSCYIEPVDSDLLGNVINPTSVAGTYRMTAFNTGIPTDLNNDRVASTNQMLETTCFNGSTIVINPDGTFRATSKGVEISSSNTLQCFSDPDYTGTWTLNATVLKLTYIDAGVIVDELFSVSANSLLYSVPQGQVIGTSATNVPIFLTTSYNIIYTK
jgi:hypothetical protein